MANTTSDNVSDITVAPTVTVTGSRPLRPNLSSMVNQAECAMRAAIR